MSKTYTQIGTEIGELVERKNAAYGDSIAKSAEALKLLYPCGLQPDQYLDALFAARDFDKRSRLAQGTGGDEDPRLDIAGYAVVALHYAARKEPATCPSASASDQAAAEPSAEAHASAPTAEPTTRKSACKSSENASASATPAPSQPTFAPTAAPAPTATEPASLDARELWLARWLHLNRDGRCAFCGTFITNHYVRRRIDEDLLLNFCDDLCRDRLKKTWGFA